jgi:Tol biopolymer transport system component
MPCRARMPAPTGRSPSRPPSPDRSDSVSAGVITSDGIQATLVAWALWKWEAQSMNRKRSVALVVGLAATLVGPGLAPVLATYPGEAVGRIAFAELRDGNFQLYSVRPDGTGEHQLTSGTGRHLCPNFSADGRWMAFCANTSGAFEIWTMKQNGTAEKQLTHLGGFAIFPDISPDGSKIAFGGTVGSDPKENVYVVDSATGEGLTKLTSCPTDACINNFPVWSPSGRKIAFIHAQQFDAAGNPLDEQVWVMNADGSNAHALTTDSPQKDQVPDWSPDGSKIAYHSGNLDMGGIWVMNADGSGQHQLTGCAQTDPAPCANGDDFGAAWSPDGTRIAFVRAFTRLGIANRPIFIMNADGSNQHQLLVGTHLQAVPAWQARGVAQGD